MYNDWFWSSVGFFEKLYDKFRGGKMDFKIFYELITKLISYQFDIFSINLSDLKYTSINMLTCT